jgi:hypothetical protein
MVDLDRLAGRARRHAERGRLLAASRVLVVVVPIGLVAALAGVSSAPCVAGTLLLAAAAVGLRWWHVDGWVGTSLGLRLGAVPYAVGLAATCLEQSASPVWAVACAVACLLASVGVVVSARTTEATRRGPRVVLAGLLVSGLATFLGCAEVVSRAL